MSKGTTIEDVYSLISKQYGEEKILNEKRTKKEDNLFRNICKSKFSIWGFVLGYRDFGSFLSRIKEIQEERKKMKMEAATKKKRSSQLSFFESY